MKDFYNEEVFNDGYEFCNNGKELNYFAPEESDYPTYVEFIKNTMPETDVPEVFGLHSNA